MDIEVRRGKAIARIEQGLRDQGTEPWDYHGDGGHKYNATCEICRRDVDAIAERAVACSGLLETIVMAESTLDSSNRLLGQMTKWKDNVQGRLAKAEALLDRNRIAVELAIGRIEARRPGGALTGLRVLAESIDTYRTRYPKEDE